MQVQYIPYIYTCIRLGNEIMGVTVVQLETFLHRTVSVDTLPTRNLPQTDTDTRTGYSEDFIN